MSEFIRTFNHGTDKIDLLHLIEKAGALWPIEARPVELHLKVDGSLDNRPSFTLVMVTPVGDYVYGQLSLNTLQECLNELGFKISPLTKIKR